MANRFRFRLEGLLSLRKALEDDARRALARTIQARNLVEAKLRELEQSHGQALESRRMRKGEVVDLDRWRATERYLVILEIRINQTVDELTAAEQRVLQARNMLTRAHQAHVMLLRLKERRQAQHAHEALLEEFRNVDEIAVLRYRFSTTRPAA
ncbi:MAG TPA: flagellar export protein FliJ, partial [Holophaga sp.]|nr:flagellar export protein FliJ [Holophaga sp.]